MKSKLCAFILFLLFLFAPVVRAQMTIPLPQGGDDTSSPSPNNVNTEDTAPTYEVRQGGIITGFLHVNQIGGYTLTATVEDWEGVSNLQDKMRPDSYVEDILQNKVLTHVAAKISGGTVTVTTTVGKNAPIVKTFQVTGEPLFFSRYSPHSLLLLSFKLPKKEGDVIRFPVIDPIGMTLSAGAIEYEGERVIEYQDNVVKAKYFVAQAGNDGAGFYVDESGKVFLIDTPLDARSYTLMNYDPKTFDLESTDKLPAAQPITFTQRDVNLPGAGGDAMRALLLTPTGSGPFPAAVVVGGGNLDIDGNPLDPSLGKPEVLRSVSEYLSNHGTVTLRIQPPAGSDPASLAGVAMHAAYWLRAQANVDPNRVFIVGYGQGGAIGAIEASKDSELASLVIISPDVTAGVPDALKGARFPVLILQGGIDSPDRLKYGGDLSQALTSGGNGAVQLIVAPGLDHVLMRPTSLQGPAAYIDPERTVDDGALQSLYLWLLNRGL